MTDPETDTSDRLESFILLGREIKVAPLDTLTQGQRLGLLKAVTRYGREGLDADLVLKLDQVLSKLLNKEDNDWLDWHIVEGDLEWAEVLTAILPCLRRSDSPPPAPTTGPKKAARRRA